MLIAHFHHGHEETKFREDHSSEGVCIYYTLETQNWNWT
jgi:hypothetical protein